MTAKKIIPRIFVTILYIVLAIFAWHIRLHQGTEWVNKCFKIGMIVIVGFIILTYWRTAFHNFEDDDYE